MAEKNENETELNDENDAVNDSPFQILDPPQTRAVAREVATKLETHLGKNAARGKLHLVYCFKNHPRVHEQLQARLAENGAPVAGLERSQFLQWLRDEMNGSAETLAEIADKLMEELNQIV